MTSNPQTKKTSTAPADTVPPSSAAPPSRRLVTALQSKGRLGKSTTMLALGSWLDAREIPWAGYDLDDEHGSFVSRYPDRVRAVNINDERTAPDNILDVLKAALREPVTLMDVRAQATELLLGALERTRFVETAAGRGTRTTVLLFPADDDDALESLQRVVGSLEDRVDYLVVKVPALSRSRRYDGSPLAAALEGFGTTRTLEVPALMENTLRALARVKVRAGRTPSWGEALQEGLIRDEFARGDLEMFLTLLHERFDALAPLLVPDEHAARLAAKGQAAPADPPPGAAAPRGARSGLSVNLGED